MASSRLTDPGYTRWLKVGQGLLKLKDLIVPDTEQVMRAFHVSVIGRVAGLPPCSCTRANIDRAGMCMVPPCGKCDQLLQEFKNAHKQRLIKNINTTNPANWSLDFWEITKLFMGAGLKATNLGAADTDTSNIVILWQNCSKFDSLIGRRQLLQDVLTVRNDTMHSPEMTCTQTEIMARFDAFINLLKDPKLSAAPHMDPNAVTSMEAIRDSHLDIVTDTEMTVWRNLIDSHSNTLDELSSQRVNNPIVAFLNSHPDLLANLGLRVDTLELRGELHEQHLAHQGRKLDRHDDLLALQQQESNLQGDVLKTVKRRADLHEGQLAVHSEQLTSQQRRVEKQERRVDAHEGRLDGQSQQLAQQQRKLTIHSDVLDNEMPQLQQRVENQERMVDAHEGRLDDQSLRLNVHAARIVELTPETDTREVLQDLRADLRDTYMRTCRDVQPIPWVNQRLPLEDVFMDVTLKRTNNGCLGQNQAEGVSVGLADILQPPEPGTPPPRRVLVEGRPGLGKSTICHRLLSGWAEGVEASSPELGVSSSARADAPSHASTGPHTGTQSTTRTESHSQPTPVTPSPAESFGGARPRCSRVQARVGSSPIGGFAIVLFLMVRNLIVGDLSDNLLCLLLGESWRSRQADLRACLGEKCQQVLILLDGFDEAALPHKELLANILEEREMRGCTVIVTSRPGFCSSRVDATFQLQGFDHQTRVRYINRFVEVVKGAADHPCTAMLVQRLKSRGIIGHLCQTPLFLVLVCVLGSQEDSALPDTRTQLYERFVNFLQRQAAGRHGFQSDYMSSLQQILQHIALTLLKDNTTEISLATIEQHSATQSSTPGPFAVKHYQPPTACAVVTLRALCQVGFLIQNYKLKGFDEVASGSFIHQSFVDYFAAKCFITMSKQHREEFIADHISRRTLFHNVFVYVAGCCGSEVLVELFDGWRRAVAALNVPRFDSSDPVSEMDRTHIMTLANHALFHDAPFSWLEESTDVNSASLALLTHGQLEAVRLAEYCTESCVRGVRTLCEALSGPQASPAHGFAHRLVYRLRDLLHRQQASAATHPLYLALYTGDQLGVGVMLDVMKQVGLTHGAVDCVVLDAAGYGVPPWTVRECESLASLPAYTRLKAIHLFVCEWNALDALSVSFTPTHALQRLIVECGPPSMASVLSVSFSQHFTEFRRNVRCLSNIQRISLVDWTDGVSEEAERDLRDWGAGRGVEVEVDCH